MRKGRFIGMVGKGGLGNLLTCKMPSLLFEDGKPNFLVMNKAAGVLFTITRGMQKYYAVLSLTK
jgi:hypothetical protein